MRKVHLSVRLMPELTRYRYDRFASDKNYKRPTLLYITGGSNIEVSGLRQKNPPQRVQLGQRRHAARYLQEPLHGRNLQLPKSSEEY